MRASYAAAWICSLLPALAACYEPEVRDCTVTCSGASTTCADDQVCGADGFCASPAVAGHCQGAAPERVTVRVVVDGDGTVVVQDLGACAARDGGDCTWQIPPHTALRLEPNGDFERWTQACAGQDDTCTIMPAESLIVGARFRGRDDD